MRNGHFSRRGVALLVAVLSFLQLFSPWPVVADEVDQEFLFASGLVSLGMPDYADKVVQQVLRLHPDRKDRAKLIQAEILISRRKFADAEEIVKTMGADNSKAQAIGLALAKGYYGVGELTKAKRLYDDFFKQYEGRVPTDPDLLRFYQESAYQFGNGRGQGRRGQGIRASFDFQSRQEHRSPHYGQAGRAGCSDCFRGCDRPARETSERCQKTL
jgi:hypothetical protein